MLPTMQKISKGESKTQSILESGETSREKINTHLFLNEDWTEPSGLRGHEKENKNDLWTVRKDFRVTQKHWTIKAAFMCADPMFHLKTAKVRHNL